MNINDWIPSGAGMEGESYSSESHPELIMKVYTVERPESSAEDELALNEYMQREYAKTVALLRCGIRVPKVLEVTRYEGHLALISQRIQNKKSFCRLAGERPELIPTLAKRMAAIMKELHSKEVTELNKKMDNADFYFTKEVDKYQTLLNSNVVLNAATKEKVQKALNTIAAEDRTTLLHGDMHFGNIITDGENDYLIDLGDVCYGHPNNDLAMFYITTHYGSDHSFDFLYHMTWQQALEFWNIFKVAYYGREISDAEVFEQLKNYMLARCVWFKNEQIQQELSDILSRKDNQLSAEVKLKALE